MFPNPQDALPLPPRPSLARYKKLAKELVRACKSADENAIGDWAERWIRTLAKLSGSRNKRRASIDRWINRLTNDVEDFARRKVSDADPNARKCALSSAQFVIARSHGFESWPKFAKHIEALTRKSSPAAKFEAAAEAIVSGDLATLKRLLLEDPDLVRATSMREHGATLLLYVAANGVESYRQKTPNNIVKITEMLLDAGAEVDATANVYGGDCTALGLVATSVHPERAGVQESLLQTLLDHGAQIEQPSIAGNQQSLVIACLANGQPKAAAFLADRGARIDLAGAVALGRFDVVKSFFDENGNLKPSATQEQLNAGFRYACGYGRAAVVKFLLEKHHRKVDLSAHRGDGQTALHWAVIGGHPEIVKLLLLHNAPLEAKNAYGGTVLGQTLWSAAHEEHQRDPKVYIAILEALVAAGAAIPERHVPVNKRVDAWLAAHGSHADPTWYWFGEEPRRRSRK
jgi:hypothetical protein